MHSMISLSFPLEALSKQITVEEILKTNQLSERYGLSLTQNDAIELMETRDMALRSNGRVEIGTWTINNIISVFCTSSFIQQSEYAQILHDLLETFYYMKNETLDLIPDEELIELMRDFFENRCKGSLELLQNRELEKLARNLRYGVDDYANLDELAKDCLDESEDEYEDEEEMF